MHKMTLVAAGVLAGICSTAHAALLVNDGGLENWSTSTDLGMWVESSSATVSQQTVNKTEGLSSADVSLLNGGYIYTGNLGQSMQWDRKYTISIDYNPLSTTGTEFYTLDIKLWLYDVNNSQITTWGPETWALLNAQTTPAAFNTWNTLSFDFGDGTDKPLPSNTAYALVVVNAWEGYDYVGLLDNIRIVAVPEPSSMLLFGLGALALRRRK